MAIKRTSQNTLFDVIVVGGGVIGSFASYWLQRLSQQRLKIAVIERDQLYRTASTVLSAGGIRQQFSVPENVRLSVESFRFLRDDYGSLEIPGQERTFRDGGLARVSFSDDRYLFLASSDSGVSALKENYEIQKDAGAAVELVSSSFLRKKLPDINFDDVKLASIGTDNEGWFDPHTLLRDVQRKSVSMGTTYIHASLSGLRLDEAKSSVTHVELDDGSCLSCGTVVNAAGAWAGRVAAMAGITLPVEPRLRLIYSFLCPSVADSLGNYMPMTVDPSGVYVRRDGSRGSGRFICGLSSDAIEDRIENGLSPAELAYILQNKVESLFFEEHIWPVLAERVPAFGELRLSGSWAGCYDFNLFDHNAVIGPHPDLPNLFFVCGFSGHGLMMSPCSGRVAAEAILGLTPRVDVERFGFQRIIEGDQLLEKNVV